MNKPSIFPVLLVHFIGMLGYSIVMPFLVFLVDRFGGNQFIYGLMGAMYPGFQLIGAPLLGRWSDSIGRRRVLLFSQLGTFLAWLLFLLALCIPLTPILTFDSPITGSFLFTIPLLLLFLARGLDGITGGNISVANAYLSDVSTDENRKANFGKMAMAASLGFILGPTIAGVLGATPYGEIVPVITAALISLLATIVIQFYLPESKTQDVDPDLNIFSIRKTLMVEQRECYQMERCPDKTLAGILKIEDMPIIFVIYFLTMLGFSFFYAGFPIVAMNNLGWTSLELGFFFTFVSLLMMTVQGPVLSYLSSRVADKTLVLVGCLFLSAFFFFLTFGNDTMAYIGATCFALGNGLMWPSFLSILSQKGDHSIQGTIQGYANSMGSLASIFGLILGGILLGIVGPVLFLVSTSVMIIIFFLTLKIKTPGI